MLTFTSWLLSTPLLIRLALSVFVSNKFVSIVTFKINFTLESIHKRLLLPIVRASRITTTFR